MSRRLSLPKDHPLRRAKWIWPEGEMYLYNHYAHFRKDFEIDRVPPKLPFYVTADKAYKLYVNGQYVCRGPARGYQSHWPFDEVDLAPYVQAGHNWISVEAYNPGISTFQYIHQTSAGFICAARWDKFELVSDGTWLARRSPGHAVQTARLSLQIDFQEHVDASKLSCDWITRATPPQGWQLGVPQGRLRELRFGQMPYTTVEPRGIPLLREKLQAPVAVKAHATGACGAGYREWENVSWGWLGEAQSLENWESGAHISARSRGGWLELILEPAGVGRLRAVTLEMPEYVVGNLVVEAEGAAGGEILDFQHDDLMVEGHPIMRKAGEACLIALGNRLRLAQGKTEHEFFHTLAFRYVTVVGRDITRPITLRLCVRTVGYPFTMRGQFECSDKMLNEIHSICRRTQQLCALDAYVDTPWREQAQWWGDARVQAQNTFYLDGDARLLRRGIRSIADQPGPQGITYGHAPTCAHNCILPDFSLTWILTIWDHYWQTGSLEAFDEQWPRVQEVLSYFDTEEARSAEGLLRHDRRYWYFGDWSEGELYRGETPAFLNLWYLLALRRVVELLEKSARIAEAGGWRARANAQEALATAKFYQPGKKLFCGGLDEKGRQVKTWSVYEQTMALMLGLAPEAHETVIRERLLPLLADQEMEGAKPSAFWVTYVLEEMAKRGYGAEVIDFIRRKWSPMLATGTTWEHYNWEEVSGSSISHAWTAHPCFHLVNILAGIRQTKEGWKEVRFSPCFAPGIGNARALIPSPCGDIEASWTRDAEKVRARLQLPGGVRAHVALAEIETEVGPGEHAFEAQLLET